MTKYIKQPTGNFIDERKPAYAVKCEKSKRRPLNDSSVLDNIKKVSQRTIWSLLPTPSPIPETSIFCPHVWSGQWVDHEGAMQSEPEPD